MSRVLFVAPAHESWGEFLHARQLALALIARGHEVTFLVSAPLVPLLRDTGCRVATFSAGGVDDAAVAAARALAADLVVLVDATLVYWNLAKTKREAGFAHRLGRVAALDVWDLARTGLRWDLGEVGWPIPEEARAIERRLLPVPFTVDRKPAGAFSALPPAGPAPSPAVARDRLAIGRDRPVILLATAGWQRETFQWLGPQRRAARTLPLWIATVLGGLPGDIVVIHVGPERWPALAEQLGDRYRHVAQCPPETFRELMAASDLHLTFNFVARSIAEALRLGVPVVVGQNRFAGGDPAALAAQAGGGAELAAWLASAVPLQPFRVWPYGLSDFLAPHAVGNPYTSAFATVEVLDASAMRASCEARLRPGATRDAAIAAAAAYVADVDRLPSGAEVLEGWL